MPSFHLSISNIVIVIPTALAALARLGSEGPKEKMSEFGRSMLHRHNEVIMTVSGHGECGDRELVVIVITKVNVIINVRKIGVDRERPPGQGMTKFIWSMLQRQDEVFKTVSGHGRRRGITLIVRSGRIATKSNVIVVTITAVARFDNEGPKQKLSVSEWSMLYRHNPGSLTMN